MPAGSFSSATLSDLTHADIDRMLELDETLFIEHKQGVGTGKHSSSSAKL